jgi:succinoglycan biosynthesis transport protein ExoP
VSSAGEGFVDRPTTLAEYQAIFRRRKWIIIALPLIAAVTAYMLSARESAQYQAKATVYIPLTSVAAAITGVNPYNGDPARLLTDQAKLATSEALASRVADKAGISSVSAQAFLGASSATPEADADLLDLSVTYPDPQVAERLVNTYAEQFIEYKNDLDSANAERVLRRVQHTIDRLRAQHQTNLSTYDDALTTRDRIEAFLGTFSATIHTQAQGAAKVRPRPKRDGILGGLLGLALGIGLAFLAEALDKRVRSEQEIEQVLGIPLLGRVPRPTRRLRRANKLVMLADPTSVHAQTFRRLRTSLEFVNFEHRARTILLTSALPREGKSTTVANLAVALARAGRRVALADLDLRRPFLHCFFNTRSEHGFTDVVVDRVRLDRAIRSVALPGTGRLAADQSSNGRAPAASPSPTNGRPDVDSILHVLPAGTIPPAADEFLESDGVAATLERLSAQFDVVLVDTPPLLAVGDVMTLSAKVDAIVVVTRLGIHRRQLEELARQLHTCRAPVLGFVLTGAPHGDAYSYGYGYDARVYEVQGEADRVREEIEHSGGQT